jgi:hypothetical protein
LVIVPKTENEDFLAALTSSLLLGYKGSNNWHHFLAVASLK